MVAQLTMAEGAAGVGRPRRRSILELQRRPKRLLQQAAQLSSVSAARMYNVFRLTGDGLHCLALMVLFGKMNQTRSCAGPTNTSSL